MCHRLAQEDTDLEGEELDECQCEGPLVVRISQLLSERLHRLTITSAGLKKLRKIGLKKYKLIQDLYVYKYTISSPLYRFEAPFNLMPLSFTL